MTKRIVQKPTPSTLTTRRQFLRFGLTGAAIAASGVGFSEHQKIGFFRRRNFDLSALTTEKSFLWHTGFPDRALACGFRIQPPKVIPGSKQEGVLIGDHHDKTNRAQLADLIDFLVSHHGFDAIGFEGFFANARGDLLLDVKQKYLQFCQGDQVAQTSLSTGHPFTESRNAPLFKFFQQQSVPTFGLEDEALYFRTLTLVKVFQIGHEISLKAKGKNPNVESVTAQLQNQVPALPKLLALGRTQFPEIPWPGSDFQSFVAAMLLGQNDQTWMAFTQHFLGVAQSLAARNTHWTSSIPKRLQEFGAKKPIIIAGAAHLDPHRLVDANAIAHNERYALDKLLPFSTLLVLPIAGA